MGLARNYLHFKSALVYENVFRDDALLHCVLTNLGKKPLMAASLFKIFNPIAQNFTASV